MALRDLQKTAENILIVSNPEDDVDLNNSGSLSYSRSGLTRPNY